MLKNIRIDYKQSEIDNDIATLKKKYQGTTDSNGHYHEGASTLISRAKSETSVLKRKGSPTINEDGSLSYKEVKETYTDKDGKKKFVLRRVQRWLKLRMPENYHPAPHRKKRMQNMQIL